MTLAKTIYELFSQALELKAPIKRFLNASLYREYEDLSGVDYDPEDPEQLLLVDEMARLAEALDDVQDRLTYLSMPITETSKLHRNEGGRWEMDSGFYFTCGRPIEALIDEGTGDAPRWVISSVESDDRGYYIVGYQKVSMDGLTVRRRAKPL